jgi:hypothetical protein
VRPLWDWITDGLGWYGFDYCEDTRIRQVASALQIHGAPDEQGDSARVVIELLAKRCKTDHHFLLDTIDALLQLYGRDRQRGDLLGELLTRSDSRWTIKPGWDGLELPAAPRGKDADRGA